MGGSPLSFFDLLAQGAGGELFPGLSWEFDFGQLTVRVPAAGEADTAAFRVTAHLPGKLGLTAALELVALGPGGVPIDGAGDLTDLPQPSAPLTFRRLSDQPWDAGYQIYRSDPIVAVADLRAAAGYGRTVAEHEICSRCDG
ncbi:MAG: hypothetical protein AAF481_20250 [Acidobacteriota bacterium]